MYVYSLVFFFNDTATTEIYTLSLHDALPIWVGEVEAREAAARRAPTHAFVRPSRHPGRCYPDPGIDRKSTRLNSSHANISYAVFCLKKKKKTITVTSRIDINDRSTRVNAMSA